MELLKRHEWIGLFNPSDELRDEAVRALVRHQIDNELPKKTRDFVLMAKLSGTSPIKCHRFLEGRPLGRAGAEQIMKWIEGTRDEHQDSYNAQS